MTRMFTGMFVAGALALALLAGSAGSAAASTIGQREQAVVHQAYLQIGKPYVWGGAGPRNFDCSGLVMYAYAHGAGIRLPHSATLIYRDLRHERTPQPGDVVAFLSGGVAYHVGIVYNPARHLMIVAPRPGERVMVQAWTWGGSSVRFAYSPKLHR